MSDNAPTDPTAGMNPEDLDPEQMEQLRAAIKDLRATPVDAVLAQVFNMVGEAIQVKLGRSDARVLIDAVAAFIAVGKPHLDSELVGQFDQAMTQLRMAQVEAEKAVAASPQAEENDVAGTQGATADGEPVDPAAAAADLGSRLWTPRS